METKSELYLSIPFAEYKLGKSLILQSHIGLLNSIKCMEKLREIKREKNALKLSLHKALVDACNKIERLEKELPHLKIPKQKIFKSRKRKQESSFVREDALEKELMDIREKLKSLAGM